MSDAEIDIPTLVRAWSPQQKQIALATILQVHVKKHGFEPLAIIDTSQNQIGLLFPIEYTVESLDLSVETPEMRELNRREEKPELFISHEELLKILHDDDANAGRLP